MNISWRGISSLYGLWNFTALERLDCSGNYIEGLNSFRLNALQYLDISGNRLFSYGSNVIDISNFPSLKYLNCSNNSMYYLDISGNTKLEELICSGNSFGSYSVDYYTLNAEKCTSLKRLECRDNRMADMGARMTLNVSGCTALEYIDLSGSEIDTYPALDLSGLTALVSVDLERASVSNVNLSGCTSLRCLNLKEIDYLSEIDVSGCISLKEILFDRIINHYLIASGCTSLTELNVIGYESGWGLQFLDVSGCTSLVSLDCYYNVLANLNVEGCTALKSLLCFGNKLPALDVSTCASLEDLECSGNAIETPKISGLKSLKNLSFSYNRIASLDVSGCTSLVELNMDNCYDNPLASINARDCTSLEWFACNNYEYGNVGYTITSLDFSGCSSLVNLACDGNKISSLNVDGCIALRDLYCSHNQLTELNLSSCTALQTLECTNNKLTELNVNGCIALQDLYCSHNKLTALKAAGLTSLRNLDFIDNPLESINASGCTSLEGFECDEYEYGTAGSTITSLDFSGCTSLTGLTCRGNKIKSLNVDGCTSLDLLYCSDNQLTELNLSSCTALEALECANNKLTELNVNGCNALLKLYCSNNQLTALNVSGCNALQKLHCSNNQLTTLDVSECTALSDLECDEGVIIIREKAAPAITTNSLKNATKGKTYNAAVEASGTQPITWSAEGLPTGLSINATSGKISGKPTQTGSFNVKITAENAYGSSAKTLSLFVGIAPSITTTSLKNATKGKSYGVTVKASGTKAITWTATGLPEGLSINKTSGKISGKATEAGSFDVKITAKNDYGSNTKTLSLFVGIAPSITTKSLKNATKSKSYSVTVKASGTTPITWSATGLPEGLSINKTSGKISGKPTQSDSFSVKITAKNAHGSSTKTLKLSVLVAPSITTKTLQDGVMMMPYSATLKAKGSTPLTWTADGLPSGLSINENTGEISGSTESFGTFSVVITAKNSVGTAKKTFSLYIIGGTIVPASESSNDDKQSDTPSDTAGENVPASPESSQSTPTQTEGYMIAYVFDDVISVDKAGLYDFNVQLDEGTPEGWPLVWIANSSEPSDDDEIADFFDSEGAPVEAATSDRKITVSVWLNPNRTYEPAIAVIKQQ